MSDDEDRDGRNAVARGYALASQATSIGLQMAIPTVVGWWIDSKWKTTPGFLIGGVVLGFAVAMLEIVRLAKGPQGTDSKSKGRRSDKNQEDKPQ